MTAKRKTKHRRPSKAEMEERLTVPLDPEELVEGILQAGPDPEAEKKRESDRRETTPGE